MIEQLESAVTEVPRGKFTVKRTASRMSLRGSFRLAEHVRQMLLEHGFKITAKSKRGKSYTYKVADGAGNTATVRYGSEFSVTLQER